MFKGLYRWIGIVMLVAAIFGGIVAYNMWNKDHADASEMPAIAISAADLYKAFETDEAKANAMYVGKVVEVTGEVSEVKSDSITQVFLTFPDAMMGGITIGIDARYTEGISSLKPGATATFKGFCSGYLTDVVLKDGILIQP